MSEKTYQETLDYIYHLVPSYQEIGDKAIKPNLDNIIQLCAHLGHPQDAYPSIHVAGTNGKGTTAHIIASILQAAGYSVGLYTSPHYMDFRERIKVDGKVMKEKQVIKFVETHQESIIKIRPSFFEVTVAMAFDYFGKKDVDFAVIETGLGGRLDSTNILLPILSVITHISLDHQHILGPDVYTISQEKAGIIKYGIPVVVGRHQPACDHAFMKRAEELEARLNFASLEVEVSHQEGGLDFVTEQSSYTIQKEAAEPFFIENASTAIRAIEVLSHDEDIIITRDNICMGLANYRKLSSYIGRWTIHQTMPKVISDSAHNAAAFKKILSQLHSISTGRIHFVLGFVHGKDIKSMLSLLDPSHLYYLTKPQPDRGMSVDELSKIATSLGLVHTAHDNVATAMAVALDQAAEEDIIYVGGSSYIVGDLLSFFHSKA